MDFRRKGMFALRIVLGLERLTFYTDLYLIFPLQVTREI